MCVYIIISGLIVGIATGACDFSTIHVHVHHCPLIFYVDVSICLVFYRYMLQYSFFIEAFYRGGNILSRICDIMSVTFTINVGRGL